MRIRIGISACLMGHKVRYDGGHKHLPEIIAILESRFECFPLCPEFAIGMGVPRRPIQLVRDDGGMVNAVDVQYPEQSYTRELSAYAEFVLEHLDLKAYVVKARSPSCGISDTPILGANGSIEGTGPGVYSQRLIELQPGLPITDENELSGKGKIDAFTESVYRYSSN